MTNITSAELLDEIIDAATRTRDMILSGGREEIAAELVFDREKTTAASAILWKQLGDARREYWTTEAKR